MNAIPRQFAARRCGAAFTLVEMLVVIAIISILMTAGSIGLSSMGGKGVTAGVATAESLFDEARTTAVGRNLRACVLVAKTLKNNPAEDLRRMVVAYEDTDAQGNPATPAGQPVAKWVLSSRGAVLPDQTFFSSKFSKTNHTAGSGQITTIEHSQLKLSPGPSGRAVGAAYEGTYFVYEFNSQGIITTPGASFIVGAGVRNISKPAADEANLPKVTGSAKRDFGGFVVWRNGRTSVFRGPDQMGAEVKSVSTGNSF